MFPTILRGAAALALLCGCSSVRTAYDWDMDYGFSALSTWDFDPSEPGGEPSDLVRRRVTAAIEATLTARGFRKVVDAPDFRVAWSIATRDRIRASGWTGYSGPHRAQWTGHSSLRTVEVDQYEEGSLIIDVIDPDQKRLVWRGTGTRAMPGSRTPEQADGIVRDAVERILAGFPPSS